MGNGGQDGFHLVGGLVIGALGDQKLCDVSARYLLHDGVHLGGNLLSFSHGGVGLLSIGHRDVFSNNLILVHLSELNLDESANTDRSSGSVLDLQLVVRSLELGEGNGISSFSEDYSGEFLLGLKALSVDLVDSVDDQGSSQTDGEAGTVLLHLGDTADNEHADGHLLREVKVGVIGKLSKGNSGGETMSHGDEDTSFADVGNVSGNEIALLNAKLASELQDFVSQVTFLLSLRVTLLEVSADTSGGDKFPEGLVDYGFTATEHESSLLVGIDDSGSEEASVLGLAEHVGGDLVGDFTEFDGAEGLPVELDGDSERFDTLDESDDNTLSLLVDFGGGLDHVRHAEPAVLVDDLHPLADLVLGGNDFSCGDSFSKVRKLETVAEKDLSEDEGRDLDSNGAGVSGSVGGDFDDEGIEFRSLGHGVERQKAETLLVKAILMLATISHVVLLSGQFNPGSLVIFGDFQDLGVNFVTRLELVEFFNVGALNSVKATDQGLSSDLADVDVEAVSLDTLEGSRDHESFFVRSVALLVLDSIGVDGLWKSQEEASLGLGAHQLDFQFFTNRVLLVKQSGRGVLVEGVEDASGDLASVLL